MERIKDLRGVTLPDGNLARRDVQSQLISVPTGKFTRNCVLTGKSSPDMDFPLYIRTPGLITPVNDLSTEGFGYFDASEGVADNAFPKHNAIATDTNYWAASNLGCWIAYHHELRPTMIRGYRFITENGYTPRVWRVEGSNDNTTWTTLHSLTVDWTWGTGKQVVEREIPAENRDYFMHHRLVVDEFDATSIRIYYLQFWDATCPSAADFYLDADAENPLQLAFADGYNPDGTPKDILFTINTGVEINLVDLLQDFDPANNPMPHPCVLFAEYNPAESSVTFTGESQYQDVVLNRDKYEFVSWSLYTGTPESILIDDSSSVRFREKSHHITIALKQPQYISSFKLRSSNNTIGIDISEDFGITWERVFTGISTPTKTHTLDRPYYITNVKLRYVSGSFVVYVYYFALLEPRAMHYKLSGGEIYQYDLLADIWNKVYKLPLGYFYIWRNPEDTQNEIGHFIPTHVPQMSVAPYFTKTT